MNKERKLFKGFNIGLNIGFIVVAVFTFIQMFVIFVIAAVFRADFSFTILGIAYLFITILLLLTAIINLVASAQNKENAFTKKSLLVVMLVFNIIFILLYLVLGIIDDGFEYTFGVVCFIISIAIGVLLFLTLPALNIAFNKKIKKIIQALCAFLTIMPIICLMWLATSIFNIIAMILFILVDIAIAIYFLIELTTTGNEVDVKEVVIKETIIEDTENTNTEE